MSPPAPQPTSAREAFGRSIGGGFIGGGRSIGGRSIGGRVPGQATDQGPRRRMRLPLKPIVGVLSAILLVSAALDIGPAVRAGLHDGTRGGWVATTRTCHGSACTWKGKFVAPGGGVLMASAQYAGQLPTDIAVGTRVPALFTGGSSLVFPVTGSDLWIELLVALLLSALGLYWASRAWLGQYVRKLRNTPSKPER
jgi:hypothetical protein